MKTNATNREKLLKNLSKGLLLSTPLLIAGIGMSQSVAARGACPAGSVANAEGACMVKAGAEAAKGEAEAVVAEARGAAESAIPEAKAVTEAKAEAAAPEAKVLAASAEAKPEAEAKAEGEAVTEAKPEAEAKGEGEAEAVTEAKAEGEAKGEGEAEAEGEGEAEGDAAHVIRPRGTRRNKGGMSKSALVERGRALYDDASLSTNGLSCNSCHTDLEGYNATFTKRYPHYVAMGKDIYGKTKISAEAMVQICMEQPMEAKPLAWDSPDLTALAAYVKVVRKEFKAKVKAEGAPEGSGEGEARSEAKGEAESR
jgi:cytochrome c